MSHAKRSEDLFANRAFPSEASHLALKVAHRHNGEVVVLISASEVLIWLEISQPADLIGAAEIGGVPDDVVPGETRTVGEKVARSGALAGDRIVELKLGQVGAHGLVPINLALIFQDGESKRRK